ncbi:hypothetical protein SCUP234_05794 [Seiridium cupressi]
MKRTIVGGFKKIWKLMLMENARQKLGCQIDGDLVFAIADSGSDLDLVSREYAQFRGWDITTLPHNEGFVMLANEDIVKLTGYVETSLSIGGKSALRRFYVLDDLVNDVVLGDGTLNESQVFTMHKESFVDVLDHEEDRDFCMIEWVERFNEVEEKVDEMLSGQNIGMVQPQESPQRKKRWTFGRNVASSVDAKSHNLEESIGPERCGSSENRGRQHIAKSAAPDQTLDAQVDDDRSAAAEPHDHGKCAPKAPGQDALGPPGPGTTDFDDHEYGQEGPLDECDTSYLLRGAALLHDSQTQAPRTHQSKEHSDGTHRRNHTPGPWPKCGFLLLELSLLGHDATRQQTDHTLTRPGNVPEHERGCPSSTSTAGPPPGLQHKPAALLAAEVARAQTIDLDLPRAPFSVKAPLQRSHQRRDVAAADGAVAAWHESAKKKVGKRFRDVAKEHESLCAEEREGVEARNVAALVRWGNEGKGKLGLEEKIQVLDQVLDGVWHFSEPDGRYSRVVEGFEVWADRVADIVAIRKSGNADDLVQGDDVLFISDLDTSWNAECSGLLRKLEAWRRTVGEIGSAPTEDGQGQRSSLSRILAACTSLVHDMLAELELMQEIEREARRAEDEWIERMNEQLKIGDHEAMDKEPPLWKMIV